MLMLRCCRFLLREGDLRLSLELATRMWRSLAVEARGLESRAALTEMDACFRWFDSLVFPPSERRAPPPYAASLFSQSSGGAGGQQQPHAAPAKELSYLLDAAVTDFFANAILKLDPSLLTTNGFWCERSLMSYLTHDCTMYENTTVLFCYEHMVTLILVYCIHTTKTF